MNVERQTVSALKWTGLAKLIGQAVSWAATLVVLRLLAPSDYGLMAIVSVIISLLANIAELGLGASVVQSHRLGPSDVAAVSGVVFALNIAIGVLVVLAAPGVAWFYGKPELSPLIRVASLSFAFYALNTIPQSLAYREMNFRLLALVDLSAVLLSAAIVLGLALYGAGVWALVVGSLSQNLVRTVMLMSRGQPWPAFRFRGVRRYLVFGGVTTLSRLIGQVAFQSDIFLAGRILLPQAIGLYSVSLHLATLPMQKIMGVVNQVAFPAVAKLQHEPERLRLRVLEASRILALFSVATLWGMSSVAPEFVRVAMGDKWLAAVFPLQVICLVMPLRMLRMIFATAALGVGNIRVGMRAAVASVIILPAAFLVGLHWGVNGLALAWVVAVPLVAAVTLPMMLASVRVSGGALLQYLRPSLIGGLSMYAAVAVGRQLVPAWPDPVKLVLLVTFGAGAFLAALLLADRRVFGDLRQVVSALRA